MTKIIQPNEEIRIQAGSKVELHFSVSIENGIEIDNTRGRDEPVSLVIGDGNLLEGFEKALFGLRAGDRRTVHLPPEDAFGQWNPRNQRPELWDLYNGRHLPGEHVRVFPLSNWTELDIWRYIEAENIDIPSLYYAHDRDVFERDNMLVAGGPHSQPRDGEVPVTSRVRYRTVGDASCTGAVSSDADTIEKVVAEVAVSRITERGATRADDRFSEAAMEDRKKEGYF